MVLLMPAGEATGWRTGGARVRSRGRGGRGGISVFGAKWSRRVGVRGVGSGVSGSRSAFLVMNDGFAVVVCRGSIPFEGVRKSQKVVAFIVRILLISLLLLMIALLLSLMRLLRLVLRLVRLVSTRELAVIMLLLLQMRRTNDGMLERMTRKQRSAELTAVVIYWVVERRRCRGSGQKRFPAFPVGFQSGRCSVVISPSRSSSYRAPTISTTTISTPGIRLSSRGSVLRIVVVVVMIIPMLFRLLLLLLLLLLRGRRLMFG
jgi:hypothetical protein